MGDMLSTGVTGLLAFQNALDTISNNVTNVNTPGYSVEATNLVTNASTQTSEGSVGNGVSVSDVGRSYSDFLDAQTRSATSGYNQFNTVSGLASTIDNMFADPTTGLSATLQGLSSSIQTMASSPSQTSSRSAVINQLQSTVSQFQGYQAQFNQLNSQVNGQIQAEASTVTSLAQSIANVNAQIQTATANSSGQAPNNLLDQRANLIDQLSQHVNVSTVTQSDGTVSVFVGSGQALVIGTQTSTLSATADPFGSGQLDLSLQATTGSNVDITSALSGGTIGGLLQFRTQMLDPGEGSVGQAAVALTNLLNKQNAAGLDQNGTIGAPLLAVGGPQVFPSGNNIGNAIISASITNLGGLTGSNYDLTYSGSSWSLVNTSSGASTALTATVAGATTTLTGGPGITLAVTGTASAGDEFLVQPTANAVAGLSLLTTDPTKIAAAGPLVTSANSANTGSASITSATVPSTAASAWTPSNYTISFSSPTAYSITNTAGTQVATGTYTPGTVIAFDGINVTLTGAPVANDSFSVSTNTNGVADNSNALLLAGIANQKVLANGAQSLSDAVNAYVGTVGLQTSQAQNGATAQQAVLNSAQTAQQGVQGVNLDEEAAKMLQYQRAYQAAAQVISTSKTLFDSLINAISTA